MSIEVHHQIQETVASAYANATPLRIVGGNSKAFLGREMIGHALDVSEYCGVINYEPTELVITAKAGTPLAEIERTLADKEQMLGFEPPHFGNATLGGSIASGLSGPRRAYAGAARDFTLGTRIITGRGEVMHFGGEVMKNVAGYDVSRLMVGAMGTLGVILEISLKVLPKPEEELTVALPCNINEAISWMNLWAAKPMAISATAFDGSHLFIRVSGSYGAIRAAFKQIGNQIVDEGELFWESVREHTHPFFPLPLNVTANNEAIAVDEKDNCSLETLTSYDDLFSSPTHESRTSLAENEVVWRISLPPTTPPLPIDGSWFIEWGGALRWLRTSIPATTVRELVAKNKGHATMFYCTNNEGHVFQSLPSGIEAIHRNLKNAFDPKHILNPGRMYPYL